MINTYVIGGAPRAGKTTLANLILKNYRITTLSTDILREALKNNIPQFDSLRTMKDIERTETLWPFFKGVIEYRNDFNSPMVIEGTNFTPKHLAELANTSHIRVCFLGYANSTPTDKCKIIRKNPSIDKNWTDRLNDTELYEEVEELIKISKHFMTECQKYNIKYFETSQNHIDTLKVAMNYLING